MKKGIVISDLHLLSWRSEGQTRFEGLTVELETAETLVLNGDIFDFRWALRPHSETIPQALEWLTALTTDFPGLDIHFIPGNHDCLPAFTNQVRAIEKISFHPHHLILGRNLFLHGDAATYRMSEKGFGKFRANWELDQPSGKTRARLYDLSDALGFSDLTHHIWFRGDIAVKRISWHLEKIRPGWKDLIDHCFFGHTHLPVRGITKDGVKFFNTGSGIRGMEFHPVEFFWKPVYE
ncbi:MAG: metallophosphoesterase [Verrucomicrobiales bacterium]|nr:metallophosphoesterase [Verrucomicrobiales bacterium]